MKKKSLLVLVLGIPGEQLEADAHAVVHPVVDGAADLDRVVAGNVGPIKSGPTVSGRARPLWMYAASSGLTADLDAVLHVAADVDVVFRLLAFVFDGDFVAALGFNELQ